MEKSIWKSLTFWAALLGFLYGVVGWLAGIVDGNQAIILMTSFAGLFGLRRALG